jgi:flavin-dependent dehydrogenase
VSTEQRFDAVVVGGGPAGSMAALELCRRGWRVALISRQAAAPSAGETLSGAVRLALERAGVWAAFERDAHSPCHESRSLWGGSPSTLEHIRDPYGPGHLIDRDRFDATLRQAARAAGVAVHGGSARLLRAASAAQPFAIESVQEGLVTRFEAEFVIDASGRGASIARRLGGRRRSVDRLSCAFASLRGGAGARLGRCATFVEPVEHGFWYRSVDAEGGVTVALFSDADLLLQLRAHEWAGWLEQYSRTRTAAELPLADVAVELRSFRVRGAAVGRLDTPFGLRWLAAGDAALTQDPLSSRGVVAALLGGLHCALALAADRNGVADSKERYATMLRAVFDQHLVARRAWYGAERRWRDAPFWRRRQAEPETSTSPRWSSGAAAMPAVSREEQP